MIFSIETQFKLRWLFLAILIFSCGEKKIVSEDLLNSDEVYLIYQGTKTKEGIVAKNFNLYTKKPSHVGVAIFNESHWEIFHVVNNNKDISALKIDSFKDFYMKESINVDYFSGYKISNLSDFEKEELKSELGLLNKEFIYFDLTFSENGNNRLYCSEMIVNIFKKINPEKFRFNSNKIKLNQFQSSYLGKDSLSYYPVDIFLNSLNLEKIFEHNL